MSVIERAEQRLQEEIRQNHLGADNWHNLRYWAAYLDGARAQKKEGGELAMSALNYVERQGFVTGMDYAGMTAEERETLLTELRNLRVGPVAPLVVEHDYAKLVKALRHLSTGRCDDSRKCELCAIYETCLTRCVLDAADAIETLQAELLKAEMRCADCEYWNKPWPEEPGQPKRGEWIVREVDIPGEIHPAAFRCMCSMCRNEYVFPRIPRYCPDCGSVNTAKMEVQDADTK